MLQAGLWTQSHKAKFRAGVDMAALSRISGGCLNWSLGAWMLNLDPHARSNEPIFDFAIADEDLT